MLQHLEFEQSVRCPLSYAFAFFANPENLLRIMPAATHTRIDRLERKPPPSAHPGTLAAGVGSLIVTSFRILPFLPLRARWIARITEFEWNHHFADVQDKGPFRYWHHRHEFVAEIRDGIEHTLIRDAIDYEIGFGPLGQVTNQLFVRHQVESTFAQRQKVLPALLAPQS